MRKFMQGRVVVRMGDITKAREDAIVNAANSSLLGGGGVDGAIHSAGGPAILRECRGIRRERFPTGLPTGMAVATTAGALSARHVIHTVGPVWNGGKDDEDRLLSQCYSNSLKLARRLGLSTIAFPAISTGVYGFPKKRAASIASLTVKKCLEVDPNFTQVVFVMYGLDDEEIFLEGQKF